MKKILSVIFAALLVLGLSVGAFAAEVDKECGLTEEELAGRLKGLAAYAGNFLEAEEDYGINACFLAAVAAAESGWGRSAMARNKNNIFGFGRKNFGSVEEGIDYVAWFLRKNYINENGKYYKGTSVADIGKTYCPDEGEWAALVTGIMEGLLLPGKE